MVIRTVLSSDTLSLPELAPFMGREVEIRGDEPAAVGPPSAEQLQARHAAAAALRASTYDYDALTEQDLVDIADQMRQELEPFR